MTYNELKEGLLPLVQEYLFHIFGGSVELVTVTYVESYNEGGHGGSGQKKVAGIFKGIEEARDFVKAKRPDFKILRRKGGGYFAIPDYISFVAEEEGISEYALETGSIDPEHYIVETRSFEEAAKFIFQYG